MTAAFQIIGKVIHYGILLGICGGLAAATLDIMREAATAHGHGLISLSKLNRSFVK